MDMCRETDSRSGVERRLRRQPRARLSELDLLMARASGIDGRRGEVGVMPVCGFGGFVCSLSLLIRGAQRARSQAEIPLSVLSKDPEPALWSTSEIASTEFGTRQSSAISGDHDDGLIRALLPFGSSPLGPILWVHLVAVR